MYYPKQIPYLLNKTFKANIEYKEYKFKELENYCMCIWQMKSNNILNETIYNYILPDACIDIVIDFSNQKINFSGFSKETKLLELNGKVDYIGVRFKPGAFYSLFHISSDVIMDKFLSFSQIEKDKSLEHIFSTQNEDERIKIFYNYLLKKIQCSTNLQFIKVVDNIYNNPKEQYVRDIAKNLGYNKRQLFRIFKMHYGVSPKVLLNILRLHLCLTLLLEENKTLSDVATICGFYDQSHFIKQLKRYTGISPIKLLEEYKS